MTEILHLRCIGKAPIDKKPCGWKGTVERDKPAATLIDPDDYNSRLTPGFSGRCPQCGHSAMVYDVTLKGAAA